MRIAVRVISTILLVLSSTAFADETKTALGPNPNPDISPNEVVRIVIDALRTNDTDAGDDGIATVWRFAAPSNKAITGPAERFSKMLKGSFGNMLNHLDSNYGPIEIKDDLAVQPVYLLTESGEEVGYLFHLRKQTTGEFEGAWMTESVFPIPPRKSGTTI